MSVARSNGPDVRAVPAGSGALVAWLVAVAAAGFFIWVIYAWFIFLDLCGGGILGPTPQGGEGESAGAAGIVGGALWLGAGVVAWRLRRRLLLVFAAFAVLYILALVVLWAVSPTIWGPMHCEGGWR